MPRFAAVATAAVLSLAGFAASAPATAQPAAALKPLEIPARCDKRDKVRIANTGHVLIYVASELARASKIFDRLCLDVKIINTKMTAMSEAWNG